jgi:hypothetical protein
MNYTAFLLRYNTAFLLRYKGGERDLLVVATKC